jgi:hypothetical protein
MSEVGGFQALYSPDMYPDTVSIALLEASKIPDMCIIFWSG